VTRVRLLEQERAELEKKHEGELTALRGQFMKALAEKDLAILDLRRDMQAQSEEKAGLQARITTLEEDLRQAQADLARYASEALRRQDARTRSGDPASRSQRPVRQPAVLRPIVGDGGADDDVL
jgi:septal ring factor EnvC (AmiA/AmiB activator)